MARKHPILAALLNFILPGTGYLYNGTRRLFGLLLMFGIVVSIVGDVYLGLELDVVTAPHQLIAGLLILGGFASDAYREAQETA